MNRKLIIALSVILCTALVGSMVASVAAHTGDKSAGSGASASPRGQESPRVPVSSGFTYQGRLQDGGLPATGQYDLRFYLYDDAAGGTQIGTTVELPAQPVSNGLFTAQLDFGLNVFQGDARWLEIAVQQAGGGGYTTLTPRQALTAAPYALSLMPGAVVTGTSGSAMFTANNSGSGSGVYGTGSTGVYGESGSNTGFGVYGKNTSDFGYGVLGENFTDSSGARGVVGNSPSGVGVFGLSSSGTAVAGSTVTGTAGYFTSQGFYGVQAFTTFTNGTGLASWAFNGPSAKGVLGQSSGYGVYGAGFGTGSTGVYGTAVYTGVHGTGSTGVYGESGSNTGFGVYGKNTSAAGYGVLGENLTDHALARGVVGNSPNGQGVVGLSSSGYGVVGTAITGTAGYFTSQGQYAVQAGTTLTDGTGIRSQANTGANAKGVYGQSSGYGVYGTGSTGVYGESASGGGYGVYGKNTSSTGYGILGVNLASSTAARGVVGNSPSGYGVNGLSLSGQGVRGDATDGYALVGYVTGTGYGAVINSGANANGLYADNSNPSGTAVRGLHLNSGYAVVGYSGTGYALFGQTGGGGAVAGTYGSSTGLMGTGVIGEANNGASAYGVWGKSTLGYAGYFSGKVHVNGTLSKSAGSFKIDHPLDPENKYLYHSFVESPDMKNIYDGVVTTDAKGEAAVTLPDWFEALNRDFRYQLTVVGQFAQAIVSREISNNRFTIKTDKPNVKVSWQVTGIRRDPYAEAHRIPVEEDKPAGERGKYLNPGDYGQPDSKGINYEREQQLKHNVEQAEDFPRPNAERTRDEPKK